jgi:hypothetical protein
MVAIVALAAGKEAFCDYSHKFSPKKFTQPQLFACLVLKEFEKKDYRGVAQLLQDCSDLREAIGLRWVPHYTTLQKAGRRLLKLKHVRPLLRDTVARVMRRRRTVRYGAGDSSGFEQRHASRYYVHRRDNDQRDENRPKKRVIYKRYGKLMLIVCCASHAILGAVASRGPTPDIDQLDDVLERVPQEVRIRHLVLDAGFDSAHNHRLLREGYGARSTIPPRHGRPALGAQQAGDPSPTGGYVIGPVRHRLLLAADPIAKQRALEPGERPKLFHHGPYPAIHFAEAVHVRAMGKAERSVTPGAHFVWHSTESTPARRCTGSATRQSCP